MDILNKKTYFYDLPENLIAQVPMEPRDHSKLLVYNKKSKAITHSCFYNIIDYLNIGDVLVINNTKVIPARLFGVKVDTKAKIEVFLLKRINLKEWEVLIKPAKRVKIGTVIEFANDFTCVIKKDLLEGKMRVSFNYVGVFEDVLNKVGNIPLPHYIKQELKDSSQYQTVYSKTEGSSAAPTAGLHFTKELLKKIKAKGVNIVEVLLHVGLGTFRPVKEDNILNHKMHTEYFEVKPADAKIINEAKAKGNRIIAVGTTSVRTLESSADNNGNIVAKSGDTNIFIYPGYKFKVVDAIITNFHLPESTLIMLISAFCGVEETLKMYSIAVKNKYRFFSFGDAMLLH